ncbi:MAG: response regulator [Deltaproteobacteria bacterium]|nr:response regulator [Deltaproteobacteria bacterium]
MIKKILIVDDSPIARKIMKTCLPKDRGYEISEATNGQEGIDKYLSVKPDLTFMDLTMPKLDGYKATEEIKKIDKNAMIVAATADIQPKSLERIMALGAFTVLKKPPRKSSLEEILDKVEKQLTEK